VTTFAFRTSFAFLGAVLLSTGIGHAVGLARFAALVRAHGIVPAPWSLPVAAAVAALEIGLGGAIAFAVFGPAAHLAPWALALGSAACGVAFLGYLRRLLRQPDRAQSCGCSPLASPLTGVSLVPAVALLTVSAVGLGAGMLQGTSPEPLAGGGVLRLLSIGWGATLALLVLVLPAVVPPRPGIGGR
jgi:hypothetical protein